VARGSLRVAVTPSSQSSKRPHIIRGAPRTVPEMQLDVLGIRNFYLRVHVTISERPSELAFHFRAHQREIDHWLTAPLNGIRHLQSEAKLHSKTGNPCEASLKTSGTQRLSSAGRRP
jgi:hypothetical protein